MAIRVIWLIRASSSLPLSTLIIRMSAHLNSVIGTSLISEHSGHTHVQLFQRFPFQMLLRLHKIETLNPHAKPSILTITAGLKGRDYPWRSSPAAMRHYQLWSDLHTAVDLHSSSNYHLDWSRPVALSHPPLKWIQIRGNISQLQWQTLKSNHRLKQIIDLKGVSNHRSNKSKFLSLDKVIFRQQ